MVVAELSKLEAVGKATEICAASWRLPDDRAATEFAGAPIAVRKVAENLQTEDHSVVFGRFVEALETEGVVEDFRGDGTAGSERLARRSPNAGVASGEFDTAARKVDALS